MIVNKQLAKNYYKSTELG